jgi:hypothetical protein
VHGRARMVVEFVPLPSVSITTKVMSSNLAHGGVYSIQYYVLKFVSDLRQGARFFYRKKLTATI